MRYDCIIVLGGGVNSQGKCPWWVKLRLEKALELYKKDFADKILLSGRLSKTLSKSRFREYKVMKEYLLSKNIPESRIILEKKSTDTFENAYYLRLILDKYKWKKIIVVTNNFHMKRARETFLIVFGKKYKIHFEEAGVKAKDPKKLRKREIFEREILKLLRKEVFSNIKKGNLASVRRFLFDKKNGYSKKFRKIDKELNEKLKFHRTLY